MHQDLLDCQEFIDKYVTPHTEVDSIKTSIYTPDGKKITVRKLKSFIERTCVTVSANVPVDESDKFAAYYSFRYHYPSCYPHLAEELPCLMNYDVIPFQEFVDGLAKEFDLEWEKVDIGYLAEGFGEIIHHWDLAEFNDSDLYIHFNFRWKEGPPDDKRVEREPMSSIPRTKQGLSLLIKLIKVWKPIFDKLEDRWNDPEWTKKALAYKEQYLADLKAQIDAEREKENV